MKRHHNFTSTRATTVLVRSISNMSTSKSIIKREKNRRYGKKSKNSNPTIVPLESLDRFAGSSEEEDNHNNDDEDDNDHDNAEMEPNLTVDNESDSHQLDRDTKMVKSSRSTPKEVPNDTTDDNEYEGGNETESDCENDDDEDNEDNINDDDAAAESYNNEDDEIDAQLQLTSGMANAMNRILSAPSKSKPLSSNGTTTAVVLSKTKTPLQIQAEKEKKLQESLKENRRVKRERQIKALHIPLTVATNSFIALNSKSNPASSSLTMELEMERMHRRVATRGIVALFNAIAHHQVRPDQTALAAAAAAATPSNASSDPSTKKNSASTKLTKNGFLDLIKQKAMTATPLYDAKTPKSVAVSNKTPSLMNNNQQENNDDPKTIKKWNALKDDYMLDSSKNWDELDDSDDDEGHDMATDPNRNQKSSHHSQFPRKKQRHDSRN